MFKYPLAVTIDTNIFDAAKFDLCDASPLKTLENYVKNGKIKVVLSDIVVRAHEQGLGKALPNKFPARGKTAELRILAPW